MRSALVVAVSFVVAFPSGAFAAPPAASPAATATPVAVANPAPAIATAPVVHQTLKSDQQVTPMGALWRSALIPGWGQRYKGEKTKGWAMTGVAGALVAGTVGSRLYANSSRHAYSSLKSTDSPATFDSKYRESVNAAVVFDFVVGSTAAFWLYNVSDCAFTPLEHLRIKDARVKDVFPAQYKYYENQPLATISVENRSNEPVSKVKLKFEAKDVLDLPAESAVVDTIPAGLGKSLSVTAAFNNKIFDIGLSEPRAIPAKITIEYEVGRKKRKIERTATFTIYNRNAIVWDDMRKLGSFVTPREETVKAFASSVAVRKTSVSSVKNIATAAAFFDAMGADGITYLADPSAPFNYFEGNAEAVDTVNFARETLVRRTGDCDDLTALYASLLESAGIATGLVDVPGHVFVIFDSGLTAEEIRRYVGPTAGFQVRNGTAWVPVEITAVGKSFNDAWAAGTGELKKWDGLKKFNVVETSAAQEQFPASPPAFGPPPSDLLAKFDDRKFASLVDGDKKSFGGNEDGTRLAAINAVKKKNLPKASESNEIGIIFAKDGKFDEAERQFRDAIGQDPKLAKAHNNLANILYLQNRSNEAAAEYVKALETGGENAAILANLANLYYEQGDAKQATAFFERAVRIEPVYEREYPEIAALARSQADASGGAIAAGTKKPAGVSKASNIGAGEKDPRRSRWIP